MGSNMHNFSLNQGSDYAIPLRLQDSVGTPLNLAGYSAQMQIRRTAGACQTIDDLTSEGESPRIKIDAEAGKITLNFSHEITEKWPSGSMVYDIEITSPAGQITRILQGSISVSAEVTRNGGCGCS